MEEGQRPVGQPVVDFCAHSLNPCCNGRGSKTVIRVKSVTPVRVLILVVMEEGQRQRTQRLPWDLQRLNPCCNGRGSKTL